MEGGVIRLTKAFIGEPIGTEYPAGAAIKHTAWQIKRPNGTFDWIPKNYGEYLDPFSAAMSPTTTYGSAPLTSVAVIPKAPLLPLKDNQIQLTDITGGRLPTSGIDHIIDLYPSDTWDEEYWQFIPDRKEHYWWNANLLEALIIANRTGERLCITGMPSTGKTTCHEQFCSIIGQPLFSLNGKEGMEPSSFVGSLGPDGEGGWAWHDGTVPLCMKIGAYLVINEIFKVPSGIQMTMQTVYEKGGYLLLDDKPGNLKEKLVLPHGNFKLHGTDNVKGTGDGFSMFNSTQMQDKSTLDRFTMFFELGYMPEAVETNVFSHLFPDVDGDTIKKVVQVANNVRNSFKFEDLAVTLSPRGVEAICNYLQQGLSVHTSIDLAYKNKLSADNEVETVKKFVELANFL